jgi:hypothetical protein
MFDLLCRRLPRHRNGDWEYYAPAFQRMTQPESTTARATPVRPGVDSGGPERPELLKTVAELTDAMQAESQGMAP